MITRRVLLAAAAIIWTSPAWSELRPGSFRIASLWPGKIATRENNPWMGAFIDQLEGLGYIEGKNLTFDARGAEGRYDSLPDLAAELISLHPNVILVTTTQALLGIATLHPAVPVVFTSIGFDPISLGVVESLPRPGGNFTGITNIVDLLNTKRLQILRDVLPKASRVALMVDALNNPTGTAASLAEMSTAAEQLAFQLKTVWIKSGDDIKDAFRQFADFKAEAFFGVAGALFSANSTMIRELVRSQNLPAIYPFRSDALEGGMLSYGPDMEAQYRSAAVYIDKILRGAQPRDLPVEQATRLQLVINLKTARDFGVEIPQLVIARADEVIE